MIQSIILSQRQIRMLPQRPKSTLQTGLIKNGGQRPFSILSLGLIGQQKPKASNKVKIHNDKKVKVKDANIKIHDENHDYSNYVSENSGNNDLKCKKLCDAVFEKNHMPSEQLNSTSRNLDFRIEARTDADIFAKPSNILLHQITNQMIEESEEKFLIKRDEINDSLAKNQGGVVNLSKKIKKVEKPKHFFKYSEVTKEDSPFNMQEEYTAKTERQQIAYDHANLLKHPFPDRQVIVDASIFRYKIINQRIDNDVDSEDEQIHSGIRRLQRCLEEAVEMNKMLNTSSEVQE